MQRWTVSDLTVFLFYRIPWKIILHFTDQIFFAGLLTQPLTRNRWRSGLSPHCSPPSRLGCWQGNTSSSEMEILQTLGWKYCGLWAGTTSSPEMEIPATLKWKHWNSGSSRYQPLGIWGTDVRRVCAGQCIFTQAIQWRIPPRMWPVTIVDKMFCELDTCVTLTKNNIGSSEDSYREGLARGKFMQMKQEIQFVCVNKYPLALCEENHLLKM